MVSISETFFDRALQTASKNNKLVPDKNLARSLLLDALRRRIEVGKFDRQIVIMNTLKALGLEGDERKLYISFLSSYFRQRPNRKTNSTIKLIKPTTDKPQSAWKF